MAKKSKSLKNEEPDLEDIKLKIFDKLRHKFIGAEIRLTDYGCDIIRSTGELSVSSTITWEFLLQLRDSSYDEVVNLINYQHHHNLMKAYNETRYDDARNQIHKEYWQSNIVIVDDVCPVNEMFVIMHPSTLLEKRQNGENEHS